MKLEWRALIGDVTYKHLVSLQIILSKRFVCVSGTRG